MATDSTNDPIFELALFAGGWWVKAFVYPTPSLELAAYEQATAVIRNAGPLNISGYRVTLDNRPIVVLIGELPMDLAIEHWLADATSGGEEIKIPWDVTVRLIERSQVAWRSSKGFVERRGIHEVLG